MLTRLGTSAVVLFAVSLLFACSDKRAPVEKKNSQTYTVFVAEHSQYQEDSAKVKHGTYPAWEEAEKVAKAIVERSLTELHEDGKTEADLMKRYMMFGKDPYIVPNGPNAKFSAKAYAEKTAPTIVSRSAPK